MPNLRGTLGPDGYHLPPGDVTVYWWHPSSNNVIAKRLNPNVPITSHFDLIGRYGEGDPALAGWQTYPAVSSESGGGEAYAIIAALYKQAGIPGPPSEQAWVDATFAELAKQGELAVGCGGYALVGLTAPPGCVESGGGAKPGQPRIHSISSPGPGRIAVSWVTREHDSFTVTAQNTAGGNIFTKRVDGNVFSTELELKPGVGGTMVVRVVAVLGFVDGGTPGVPSLPKMVNVVAAPVVPIDPIDPPHEPPPPPPPPPLDVPPAKLSAEARATIVDVRARINAGKQVGLQLTPRLAKLLDEVERLIPS